MQLLFEDSSRKVCDGLADNIRKKVKNWAQGQNQAMNSFDQKQEDR